MKLAARDGTGNILALAIEAARERATVGEMSYALEEVYTRYSTTSEVGKGQYVKSFKNKKEIEQTIDIVDSFTRMEGRKPKMLVVKMGQDGHDRGAKVIASAFIDFGFDVKVGPLFQTPSEAAEDALNGKFDIIGISTQAAGHKTLAPKKPILNGDEYLAPDDVEEQGNYIDRMGGGYGWPLILIGMAVATVILSVYAL